LVSLEAEKLDLSEDWEYRSQVRLAEASAALLIYQNDFLVPNLRFDSARSTRITRRTSIATPRRRSAPYSADHGL